MVIDSAIFALQSRRLQVAVSSDEVIKECSTLSLENAVYSQKLYA